MKFGEQLHKGKNPEWADYYMDYSKLKGMILELEQNCTNQGSDNLAETKTSLSVPRPTNAAGVPTIKDAPYCITQEMFFIALEQEMAKIGNFTKNKISVIRSNLGLVEGKLGSRNNMDTNAIDRLQEEVTTIAEDFLQLEKYVNLNFTGFHKILKKHDRRLPNPCKSFYIARLHQQSWVRGDYSDVLVSVSKIFGLLRGDEEGEKKDEDKQDFCRTTTKYWVHKEDISRVKYAILQHLPVFLQSEMGGETDSQLVNSVYLDNRSMELYNGRLDKTPGAIALRMRWYSTAKPETVFVERKTHRESWAGDVSVKERFIVPEKDVQKVLDGTFDLDAEVEKMKSKGKKPDAIKSWLDLSSEILQVINTKQLTPTLRTQYMRTAFQIPFDPTVRVSIDTNLVMINEITKETAQGERWYRDPTIPVPLNEITRFPHAILEVKLCLLEGQPRPDWVTSLVESGSLMQVHKFSKFIHGCAVLLPDDVSYAGFPYWIDDPTLFSSIEASGAARIVNKANATSEGTYQHMLPHDEHGAVKQRHPALPSNLVLNVIQQNSSRGDEIESVGVWGELCGSTQWLNCCSCEFAGPVELAGEKDMIPQKIEPKLILANERTFIKWLHMAVILSAIATGALAFSSVDGRAQYYALAMLPVSLLMIVYALWTYLWRCEVIKTRTAMRWDDPLGPVLLTVVLILVLTIQFILKLHEYLYPQRLD